VTVHWIASLRLLFMSVLLLACTASRADELRPAYLDMRETKAAEWLARWKVPAAGDLRLGLYVRLPDSCKTISEPVSGIEANAYFEHWRVSCPDGLKGQTIAIDGLRNSVTDVLVRIEYLGGATQVARLGPGSPAFAVAGVQTRLEVAATYFFLGIDHILTSLDHLLFVFALMLLISDFWKLAKTITAFTVAHSITLAASSLGYISLPQQPVEATIALSIAFLASELVKMQAGQPRLSERFPWIVAFAFGLLHGFGFAGALKDIGLPQTDVSLALLMFNVGVEAGQLIFVGAILTGLLAARFLYAIPGLPLRKIAGYLIGTASMVWLTMRLGSF
jgi:hydrogenase/urease accessory protein HupE